MKKTINRRNNTPMKTHKFRISHAIVFLLIMSASPLFSDDASSNLNDKNLPTIGPISSSSFEELNDTLEKSLEKTSDIGLLFWSYSKDGSIQEGNVNMQLSLNIWAANGLQRISRWYLELEFDPLTWEIIIFHLGHTNYDPFYPDDIPEENYSDMLRAAELEELIDKSWYENLIDLLNIRNGIASENGYGAILNFANGKIYSAPGDGGGSSGFSYELIKE